MAGLALGSAAAVSAIPAESRTISGALPVEPSSGAIPPPLRPGSAPSSFLTDVERRFIDVATSRLIPTDESGPGAKDADVTTFIDRQLAGAFGSADTWYMQGPWQDGTASQGYQSRLTPAQMYRAAIAAIDRHCSESYGGKSFADLAPDDQDKILSGLEAGDITLDGANAKTFFELFLQNTIEGFFSDPIYGGNRDMVGWSLVGFPGARYDYRDYVSKHGEKFSLPPVGITGRPDWTPHS